MAKPQALVATDIKVEGLFVVGSERIWSTESHDTLDIDFDGIAGDRHAELTRTMQGYESEHLSGRVVANDKQVSLVGSHAMVQLATEIGLDVDKVEERAEMHIAQFMAERLAANILVSGSLLNHFADPGVVFAFGQERDDINAAVRITEYNMPCKKPLVNLVRALRALDMELEGDFNTLKERFKEVAAGRRGWVASTYIAGQITVGDSIFKHRPVALPGRE